MSLCIYDIFHNNLFIFILWESKFQRPKETTTKRENIDFKIYSYFYLRERETERECTRERAKTERERERERDSLNWLPTEHRAQSRAQPQDPEIML